MVSFRKEEGAQAYILVAFILAAVIVAAVFSVRTAYRIGSSGTFEIENLKRELAVAYANGIYSSDLNRILSHTSEKFKEFYTGKQFTLKLLFTAYDENGYYILGNYWGQDCSYSTSVISGTVKNNTTHTIAKETLLNDYSLIFCGINFNLENKFLYRAELHRGVEVAK
jgi:hypothetical protein